MPHVLIAGRLHDDGMRRLRERSDIEVEAIDTPSQADIEARLPEADALIVRTAPVTARAIEHAPHLRVVSRHGVGYDNVDVAALTKRGIPLTVVGDVNAVTVAEYAMSAMLALAKQIVRHDAAVRRDNWAVREELAAGELWHKTLLILGLGRIGREVAKRALAFDMTVVAYDPYIAADAAAAVGCTKADDLMAALREADFVSVHMPLTPETRGIISTEQLAAMRPTAFLINSARGGLVDENALVRALDQGVLAGAAVDTFEREPPEPNEAILRNERVLLSPHNAGLTEECARRMAVVCAETVLGTFDGTLDPALVVNKEVLP